LEDKQAQAAIQDIAGKWGWMLAIGIVMVILGTIGLGMTATLTAAGMIYFGILMILGGIAQLLEVFQSSDWKGRLWHLLIALVYGYAGVVMILNPALASTTLTLMIAAALIAIGILRIIASFQMRGTDGWIWGLIGGIITLVLGGMIAAQWPVSGLWIIGMFIAIEMLMAGWSYIAIALTARRISKQG
jgi:uncharacterized membrane protein HdeD (DUF308 family)